MDNKTIYKKTLGFSLLAVIWNLISIALVIGLTAAGFIIAEKAVKEGLIGLLIGLIIGLIAASLVSRFAAYTCKAGQIAMMTKAITEGELPDNVIAEGKRAVKERFITVAAFFAVTSVIKGIFNQIGRMITRFGENIGGDTGGAIGSTVSSVIQVVVSYLCDCCLGWVFYRKDVKAAKATCEGAVLFFKHGKTLAKNMGRVFGMGLVSLIAIGGAFAGVFYAIISANSTALSPIITKVTEFATTAEKQNFLTNLLQNPATVPVVIAVVGGIIVWSLIHSTFIRPFVLTGVLRNYIESGKNDIPSEESFSILDSKSPRFKKLHSEL